MSSFRRSASFVPAREKEAAVLSPDRVFHSVHERNVAESIMKKIGTYSSGYCTVERQVQEREREWQRTLEVLKYSPLAHYMAEGEPIIHQTSPTAVGVASPSPSPGPVVRSQRKMDLGDVDPSPANIARKQRLAEESLKERRHKMLTSKDHIVFRNMQGVSALEYVEEDLRRVLADTLCSFSDTTSTRSMTSTAMRPTSETPNKLEKERKDSQVITVPLRRASTPKPIPTAPQALHALPEIVASSGGYSSTLMQLRRTRQQVVEHGANVSAVRSILNMQGSTDMKRTITRMFADPHKAAQISDEEYKRRERLYEEDRARNLEHQAALLKADREVLEKEMSHWK